MRALRRRHGRSTSSDEWSARTRAWWKRAEAVAPRETMAYRKTKTRRALDRLKEKMR